MKIQALQVGSIGTNCYILCDEAAKVCAVIDPGAEPELILSAAEKLDCTVDKILLTHGHYDHTGAVAALMETLPPTAVYIHQADFDSPPPFPRRQGGTTPRLLAAPRHRSVFPAERGSSGSVRRYSARHDLKIPASYQPCSRSAICI